jgi:iron complex transport system ATP-binding protein
MKLKLVDISFRYGKKEILKHIDLSLDGEGVYCLLGPNGSGKSTMLKCIMQFLHPRGQIIYDDMSVCDMKQHDIAKLFGYVPQNCSSNFPITVFDMILLGRKPYIGWRPSDEDISIVEQNIWSLGLEQHSLKYVNQLSGGERQKVMIAAALCQEPKVLLLDEPTSSLDVKHQIEVMRRIMSIAITRQNIALVAMHDLNLAAQYSNTIIMMKDGRIYAQGMPGEVLTKENIAQVYGIDVDIVAHGKINHIVPTAGTNS